MAFIPIIDESRCNGCEECVEVCPTEVLTVKDGKSVPVNDEGCMGCECCVDACSVSAIEI